MHCESYLSNKSPLLQINRELTESVVTVDWENGYVEASAKDNTNVTQVRTINYLIYADRSSTHPHLLLLHSPTDIQGTVSAS